MFNGNPQRQRRPGGGFGGGQQQAEQESEELTRPDTSGALEEIEAALAAPQEQELRRRPCGCW